MIAYDIEHRIEIPNGMIVLALIVLAVGMVAFVIWLFRRRKQ